MLRIQQYDFKVIYNAGTEKLVDFLSRNPIEVKYKDESIAEEYINFLTNAAVPQAMTVEEIKKKTTQNDNLLRALRAVIRTVGIQTV